MSDSTVHGERRWKSAQDASAVLLVGAACLIGFLRTYDTGHFLAVGLFGVLLGECLAWLAHRLKQPLVVLGAITVIAFFLLGGAVALNGLGSRWMLPFPATLKQLANVSVFGWKQLLTTLPPVDGRGPFLVLPYLIGLTIGVSLLTVALRSKRATWVALLSALFFALVILLGVQRPSFLLAQGLGFSLVLLAWVALRARRQSIVSRRRMDGIRKVGTALALVAVASAISVPLARMFAPTTGRVVFRTYVQPPFDIGRYPSPLAAFRVFVKPATPAQEELSVFTKEILSVQGLEPGTRLRFAVLDQYDGSVWGATNEEPVSSTDLVPNAFQRVNRTIDNPGAIQAGKEAKVKVTLGEGYRTLGVWTPTAGAVTHITFAGVDSSAATNSFRYNLATNVGVVPTGLREGESYQFHTVLPRDVDVTPDMGAGPAGAMRAPDFIGSAADKWSSAAAEGSSLDRVLSAAKYLKEHGRYTNGEAPFEYFTAGHYSKRLSDFITGPQMAGDDEQFAATMALVANQIGVPSRVVVGAKVPAGGVVKGKDVQAWLEIQAADGTWRTLPTESFMDVNKPPEDNPPVQQPKRVSVNIPPPAPQAPKNDASDPFAEKRRFVGSDGASWLPLWFIWLMEYVVLPIGLIAGTLAWIIILKKRRRRRRRMAERHVSRFIGGWEELLDEARDFGWKQPKGQFTRPEQGVELSLEAGPRAAIQADVAVFGGIEPSAAEAEEFWTVIDSMREELARERPRWRRLVALVNPMPLVRDAWGDAVLPRISGAKHRVFGSIDRRRG